MQSTRSHQILIAAFALAGLIWPAVTPIGAHVAFTVFQPGAAGKAEPFVLSKQAAPKAGSRLEVWLSADEECEALVVAFDAAGQPAWPGQPVLISLQPHNEQTLPAAGEWKWERPHSVTEFDVLMLDRNAPALPKLKSLAEAMRAGANPAVRARQVAELRRLMGTVTQRADETAEYSLKTEPVSLAGLLRGMGCDWCKDAQKVAIPRAGAYLVRQRFP